MSYPGVSALVQLFNFRGVSEACQFEMVGQFKFLTYCVTVQENSNWPVTQFGG